MGLQVQPELRAVAEIEAEPQRRVGGDALPVVDDLGAPVGRDADRLGEPVLRQPVFPQELLAQHLVLSMAHRVLRTEFCSPLTEVCIGSRFARADLV